LIRVTTEQYGGKGKVAAVAGVGIADNSRVRAQAGGAVARANGDRDRLNRRA